MLLSAVDSSQIDNKTKTVNRQQSTRARAEHRAIGNGQKEAAECVELNLPAANSTLRF
jgi:hypothetical protein